MLTQFINEALGADLPALAVIAPAVIALPPEPIAAAVVDMVEGLAAAVAGADAVQGDRVAGLVDRVLDLQPHARQAGIEAICALYGSKLEEAGYKGAAVRKSELKKILEAACHDRQFAEQVLADRRNLQALAAQARKVLKGEQAQAQGATAEAQDRKAQKAFAALRKNLQVLKDEGFDPLLVADALTIVDRLSLNCPV